MDFSILYAIQNLRCDALDRFILFLTKIAGSSGEIWLVVGAALLLFKKTRKAGFSVLLSYAFVYALGQFGLKELIARASLPHRYDRRAAHQAAVELLLPVYAFSMGVRGRYVHFHIS